MPMQTFVTFSLSHCTYFVLPLLPLPFTRATRSTSIDLRLKHQFRQMRNKIEKHLSGPAISNISARHETLQNQHMADIYLLSGLVVPATTS